MRPNLKTGGPKHPLDPHPHHAGDSPGPGHFSMKTPGQVSVKINRPERFRGVFPTWKGWRGQPATGTSARGTVVAHPPILSPAHPPGQDAAVGVRRGWRGNAALQAPVVAVANRSQRGPMVPTNGSCSENYESGGWKFESFRARQRVSHDGRNPVENRIELGSAIAARMAFIAIKPRSDRLADLRAEKPSADCSDNAPLAAPTAVPTTGGTAVLDHCQSSSHFVEPGSSRSVRRPVFVVHSRFGIIPVRGKAPAHSIAMAQNPPAPTAP